MSGEQSVKPLSGSEIVANFLETIKKDSRLDQPTVGVIEALHKAGKLTVTNLQNALEELRKGTKA
jgi:hypothetical protein